MAAALLATAWPAGAGTLAAVGPGAASVGATLQITGTGFNGAAAQNDVTFTPSAGPPITVQGLTVSAATSTGNRILTVKVPAGVPVGVTALEVVNRATGERSAGRSIEVVSISLASVTSATQGAASIPLVLNGSPNVIFRATTRVSVGAGITVSGVTIVSPTELRASLAVAATATPGPRTITVLGTTLQALLPDAFTVAATVANTAPAVTLAADPAAVTLPINTVTLAATITDDGLPVGGASSVQWTQTAGPVPAAIAAPTQATTQVVFTKAGTYTFEFVASDGALSTTRTVHVLVHPPPNSPPLVDAGPDKGLVRPATRVALDGVVTDDGLPDGGVLQVTWSQQSGPPGVAFDTSTSATTMATLPAAGTYVLRLSATDGALEVTDTVTVVVTPATNTAPTTDAGPDRLLQLPADVVTLSASASDDGFPEGGVLTFLWSQTSGPEAASITQPSAATTSVTFPRDGIYAFQILVRDGDLSATDSVVVEVRAAAVANAPPAVTASSDSPSAQLPSASVGLTGAASDDGLPSGGSLTYRWSRVSGPLGVSFDNETAPQTRARFSGSGTFVLRLAVSDGELAGEALVTVAVEAEAPPPPPAVNQPPAASASASVTTITLPSATTVLSGAATDDGLPGAGLAFSWVKQSGPATVTFGNAGSSSTSAFFTASGVYVLRLDVHDGALTGSATVAITVAPEPPLPPPANAPPIVTATANPAAVTLPVNLTTVLGTATDDGRPGPGLTSRWTTVSGPAPVSFDDAAALATTARFSVAGDYTLRLTVSDGQDTASQVVAVVVHPGAPPPPVNRGPTARAGGPYSGDAGAPIALSGRSSSDPDGDALTYVWDFGDGEVGSGPAPTHVFTAAQTHTVTLTVSDGRGGSHSVTTTAVIGPPADRAPPSVRVIAPAEVLPGETVVATADVADNAGVRDVTFTVDGQSPTTALSAPYERSISIPSLAAPGTRLTVRAVAVDTSGNVGAATAEIVVVAQPDTSAPDVVLRAPEQVSPGQRVPLAATASDNAGVRFVRFTFDQQPASTDAVTPYEAVFTVPADAAIGSVIVVVARATDFAGNSTDAVSTIAVVAAPDTTPPTLSLVVPDRVAEGTTFDVEADARDAGGIASVAFTVDGVPVATSVSAPHRTRVSVPATKGPGSVLSIGAVAQDTASLTASATATVVVVGGATSGTGLATGEVYDDSTGLPLAGARVRAIVGGQHRVAVADARGQFALLLPAADHRLHIERDGFSSVERLAHVPDRGAVEVIDARLTPLGGSVAVAAAIGGTAGSQAARAIFDSGALTGDATVRVTAVSAQGLRGLLPFGWSPVAAVDVTIAGATTAAPFTVQAAGWPGVDDGVALTSAVWDVAAGAWRVVQTSLPVGSELSATVGGPSQVVWLLADAVPASPDVPTPGELLTGVAAPSLDAAAGVTVSPDPRIAVYDPAFRSSVTAALVVPGPIASGLVLRARLIERYEFLDRQPIAPDPFVQDVVLYQDPARQAPPAAVFTVSPSVAFEPAALAEGVISVELLAPGGRDVTLISDEGGRVAAPTGESVVLAPHAAGLVVAARIERLAVDPVSLALPASVSILGAVTLSLGGYELPQPGVLAIPRPAPLVDETGIFLVRLTDVADATRLELVAVGRIAGDQIVSDIVVEGVAAPLPGVRRGGRYLFLRIDVPFGLVAGTVRDESHAPASNRLVTISTLPFAAVSQVSGAYLVAALPGTNEASALDALTFDSVRHSVAVAAGGVARLDLRIVPLAPRVTSVTPAHEAAGVALATPVVVSFSEPIDPASVGALVLETSGGAIVAGATTLSEGNRTATWRPVGPLSANTLHRVRVTTDLADTTGRRAASEFTSTFTTLDTAPRPLPQAGAISATVPLAGTTTIRASQGTAGLRDTVRIHNLTTNTFQIALVNPDGSFEATLAARIADRLRIGITTSAGVETTVDLARFVQENPDGSITSTVSADGGVIDGPNGSQVEVPPGAFPRGAVITVQFVSEADFPVPLTARQRADLQFTGGLRLDFHGAVPAQYLNLSVPAGPQDTFDDRWVVTEIRTVRGVPTMIVADTARVIGGRIKTSSPPCPGALASATYGFVKGLKPIGLTYGRFVDPVALGALREALNIAVGIPGAGFQAWAVAQDWQRASEGTCLPSLAGRVTVTPNTQKVVINAAVLTPADRQVVVRNTLTNQTFYYPRNVVEFRRAIFASATDLVTVHLQTAQGEQAVAFDRRTLAPGQTIEIHVDMDAVAVPSTGIVIRNQTRDTQVVVPLPQLDAAASISGRGVAGDYEVKVVTASGVSRVVPFTLESPTGTGALIARVIPLTIDPGTETTIRNTTTGESIVVPAELIAAGQGGFAFDFEGRFEDTFAVMVRYLDGSRLAEVFNVPKLRLVVSSPTTGAVVATYDVPVPPQDEPFNVGAISGDKTRPFVVGTPENLAFFNTQHALSFTFSEGIDRQSALDHATLTDEDGHTVEVEVRLSAENTIVTLVPRAPLKLGAVYTVSFGGVTDGSGNGINGPAFTIRTFEPRRVGPSFRTGDTFPPTSLTTWRRDVEGQPRTFAAGTMRGGGHPNPNLALYDLTDVDLPGHSGRDSSLGSALTTKRTDVTLGVVNLPITTPLSAGERVNPCGGGGTYSGDLLAVTTDLTGGGGQTAGIAFYDVSNPAQPCRLGGKALVSTLPGLGDQTVRSFGFAGGVSLLTYDGGLLAFVAVERVGLFSVEVGKWIYPQLAVAAFQRDPYVPGDYRRVEVAGNRVVAMNRTSASIDIYDPNLALLTTVRLGFESEPLDMDYVEAFQIDLNDDGVIDGNELRSLVFVGGTKGVSVVDITDLNAVTELTFVPLSQKAASVRADRDNRRVMLSAHDPFVPEHTDERQYLLDFSTPRSLEPGDRDGDGDDDRVVWKSPIGLYAHGGGRLLAFDVARGVFYVAAGDFAKPNPPGIDTWALDSLCCDVRVDMTREVSAEGPEGDRDALIAAEISVLSKGIAKGLAGALNGVPGDPELAACNVTVAAPGQPATISILEQGSGSCIWKDNPAAACSGNYQPGLSDHDYEVFMPEAYFAGAVGSRKADCVVRHLSRVFTARDGTPIEFDVDGQTIRFDDITFFPFRKEGFDNARLDLLLPENKDGDTMGDLGLGRQSLLLLWLVGGEYIDLDDYNVQGPSLSEILRRLKTETKIPPLEGYEWANLQRFNLYKTSAFVRVRGASNATSAFHDLFIKQLHDAGKAGIRTIFGRLIANPLTSEFAYRVRRAPQADDPAAAFDAEQDEGPVYTVDACLKIESADVLSWTPKPCVGFEEYVASVAARTITELNLNLFTPQEILDVVHKMWRVKGDVQLPTRKDVRDDQTADEFIALVATTITAALDETRPAYEAGLPLEPPDRSQRRTQNLTLALQLLQKKTKASLHVVPRVANVGFRAAEGVPLVMWRGTGNLATRVNPKNPEPALRVTLAGGDAVYMRNTKDVRAAESFEIEDGDRNLADLSDYDTDNIADVFRLGDAGEPDVNPLIDQNADRGVARWVAFTIDLDLPQRTVREANRQNNWDGFYYYVLDPANPGPPDGTAAKVPLPVPNADGRLLDPDDDCDPPFEIEVTQTIRLDGLDYETLVEVPLLKTVNPRYTVRNLSLREIDGVQVCSTLTGECHDVGVLLPAETLTVEDVWTAPAEPGQRLARVIASSSDGGARSGNPITVVIGCEQFVFMPADPDPNPTGRHKVMQGGSSYRYYRVLDLKTGQPAGPLVSVDVEVTSSHGDFLQFNFPIDAEGWVGFYSPDPGGGPAVFTRGMVIPVPLDSPKGTVFQVTAKTVDEGSGCAGEVAWQIEATERTFTGVLAAGASVKAGAKLVRLVDVAVKGGFGYEAVISSTLGQPSTQIALTTQTVAGLEGGVKKAGGTKAKPRAAGFTRGFELALQDKFTFPLPMTPEREQAFIAAILQPVVAGLADAFPHPFASAAIDQILTRDPFGVEAYHVSDGGQLQISQEIAAKVAGAEFTFGKIDEVQLGSLGFTAGFELLLKGVNILAADLTRAPPRTLTVSAENRSELHLQGGVDTALGGIQNADVVQKILKSFDFIAKYFKIKGDAAELDSVKFEASVNSTTQTVEQLLVTVLEKKKYGLVYLGDKILDQGSNKRYGAVYTVKLDTDEKRQKVLQSLAVLDVLASVSVGIPAAFSFTEEIIGAEVAKIIAFADSFELMVEDGSTFKAPQPLKKWVEKVTTFGGKPLPIPYSPSAEDEYKIDGSTRSVVARGVVLQGESFVREVYDEKDLPKSGPQALTDLLTKTDGLFENLKKKYEAGRDAIKPVTALINDLTDITVEFSPSGATLQVDGRTDPMELDLAAWPFRPIDPLEAPLTLAPSAMAGRADQPHNGIGGFFWYLPEARELVTPATLTIRWLDEEVAGLDEGSIRIYEWNATRQDWDLIGGVVDAAANQVTATIGRLGLFTAAPSMPVGRPGVSATVTPAADDTLGVEAVTDEIRLNTGALVPDGTRFTVYTVAGEGSEAIQVGVITSADLDPALDGVQLATQGGRLSLTATIPAAFGGARLVAWPAAGGTAFIDAPVEPPQP